MMTFDANALYSLEEMREALRGIVELPTFLERLGLRDRRVFKGAVWGWEVLEAAHKAPSFAEGGKADATAAVVDLLEGCARTKGRRKQAIAPAGRLSASDLRD